MGKVRGPFTFIVLATNSEKPRRKLQLAQKLVSERVRQLILLTVRCVTSSILNLSSSKTGLGNIYHHRYDTSLPPWVSFPGYQPKNASSKNFG